MNRDRVEELRAQAAGRTVEEQRRVDGAARFYRALAELRRGELAGELAQEMIDARPEPEIGMRAFWNDGHTSYWGTFSIRRGLFGIVKDGDRYCVADHTYDPRNFRLPGEPGCPPDPTMADYVPRVGDGLWFNWNGGWHRETVVGEDDCGDALLRGDDDHDEPTGLQQIRTNAMLISRGPDLSAGADSTTEGSGSDAPEHMTLGGVHDLAAPYGRNPAEPKVGDRSSPSVSVGDPASDDDLFVCAACGGAHRGELYRIQRNCGSCHRTRVLVPHGLYDRYADHQAWLERAYLERPGARTVRRPVPWDITPTLYVPQRCKRCGLEQCPCPRREVNQPETEQPELLPYRRGMGAV